MLAQKRATEQNVRVKIKNNMTEQFLRIRTSWVFLIKVSFGILAAFVTVLSIFKLDAEKVIHIASNANQLIFYLGCIIVYGLTGEYFLSAGWSESDSDKLLKFKLIVAKIALFIFMLSISGMLTYLLGYINGYLDSYAAQ